MGMGITQALKLQEGPIDALATLPQQQLIQMAQQGRIPADMLPVILNEKAQMAQAAANMQAMQQPMPPSVIEQAMATNAQTEAQSQMPPMDTGVASLPVPEQMYGNEYAGGGIVAFQGGGSTLDRMEDVYGGSNMFGLEDMPTSTIPKTTSSRRGIDLDKLKEIQEQLTAARKAIPFGEGYEAYKRYLQGQETRAATEAYQDKWMRILQAGLGITGGESPYALTNIGKGAQTAVAGAMEDAARRRKEAGESLKGRAELDRLTRAEQLEGLKSAESMYGKEVDRLIAAESKSNEMKDYIKVRTDAAILNGDKRPRAVIEDVFAEQYIKLRAQIDPRMLSANAALTSSNVGAAKESTQDYEAAARIVNEGILARGSSKDPRRQKYNDLVKEDQKPENKNNPEYVLKAPAYRDQLISDEINKMRGGRSSTAPAAPAAAPATKKFEVKTPDGRTFTFPNKEAADAFKARIGG